MIIRGKKIYLSKKKKKKMKKKGSNSSENSSIEIHKNQIKKKISHRKTNVSTSLTWKTEVF